MGFALLCLLAMVTSSAPLQPGAHVVIAGAGLHGAALAYYLTQRGVKPTIIETHSVAAAASGKGGGFLARDWGSGPTVQLHKAGFALHAELAAELGVTSYRKLPVLRVSPGKRRQPAARGGGGRGATIDICPWLDGEVADSDYMDKLGGAQVAPRELCEKLMAAALAGGATLRIATVAGVHTEPTSVGGGSGGGGGAGRRVTGVVLAEGDEVLPCDALAVCMGPWSAKAAAWFKTPVPMVGVKSTSLVFRPTAADARRVADGITGEVTGDAPAGAPDGDGEGVHVVEPYALFCGEDERYGTHLEVYPRPNGDIYVCGIGGSEYVPGEALAAGAFPPGEVAPDPARVQAAVAALSEMSRLIACRPPVVEQACMRPCPPDALPIMSGVSGLAGAFISAGHNCWGILWAPISGKAMAELIVDGAATSVDLAPFAVSRFAGAAEDGRGGRGRKQGEAAVGEQW